MAVFATTNTFGIIEFHTHEAWRAQTCFALLQTHAAVSPTQKTSRSLLTPKKSNLLSYKLREFPKECVRKKHTDVCKRSQGKGTRNDLKPHFIHVSSYFLFSFPRSLIHKTAPIRKPKRNHTGRKTKPQIRDVILFAFTDLFPFFGHGPAMKKSHNILSFLFGGNEPSLPHHLHTDY